MFEFHESGETVDRARHGKLYESEIGMFVLHRLIKQDFKNFKFTREKKGLGKFDDLVFIYDSESKITKYRLMQIKHKRNKEYKITYNDLINIHEGPFYLPKYFYYYINEFLETVKIDQELKNSELEELIICTNADFEDDLQHISKRCMNGVNIFQGSGELYKLEIPDAQERKKIFADQFLSDQEQLAKELALCMTKKQDIKMKALIEDENYQIIKKYLAMLLQHVFDANSKRFKDSFLEDLTESLVSNPVHEFKEIFFNFLPHKGKRFNYRNRINTLKNTEFCFDGILLNNYSFVPFAFQKRNEKKIDENIIQFLKLLTFSVKQNRNEQIMYNEFGCSENVVLFCNFYQDWHYKGSYFDQSSNKRMREWITKEKLLNKAENINIIVQGRSITISDLLPITSRDLMTAILQLSFCEKMQYEIHALPLDTKISYFYVKRNLRQPKKIYPSLLSQLKNDILIVSLTDKTKINKFKIHFPDRKINEINNLSLDCYIYYTDKYFDINYFHKICKESEIFASKNFHWVTYLGTDFRWEYSKTLELPIIMENDNCLISEDIITKYINKNFIIVTGEPGNGKSLLLQNAYRNIICQYENKSQPIWVLRIELNGLNECKGSQNCALSELKNPELTNEEIVNFFSKCEDIEDHFSKLMLTQFLHKGQIVLLLDGFDELHSNEDQEKIIGLLCYIKNHIENIKILITSRRHCIEKLENCLGVVAFEIDLINEEEQISIVIEHWKQTSAIDSSTCERAKRVVEEFNENIKDKERKFLGIPLHTFMLAVALEANSQEIFRPGNFMFCDLYEFFIKRKIRIFCEKRKLNHIFGDELIIFYENLYKNLALDHCGEVLPDEVKKLKEACMFIDYKPTVHNEKLVDIGIISQYKRFTCHKDKTYKFVHTTFAEYLIADLLVRITFSCNDDILSIVNNILLRHDNSFTSYIFDCKLVKLCEEYKTQRAIMLGDIETLASASNEELNKLDRLGRCHFYYGIKYERSVIELLIKKQVKIRFSKSFRKIVEEYFPWYFDLTSHEKLSPELEKLYWYIMKDKI